jgi:hypothetical protein
MVYGETYLSQDTVIYVMVGNSIDDMNKTQSAPWNGGGSCRGSESSGSGAGATDIRLTSAGSSSTDWKTGINSRLMVAGGGGGAGHRKSEDGHKQVGGDAGAPNGGSGRNDVSGGNGSGGTLTSGYALGQGEDAATDAGAGGAGYYGGKAGKHNSSKDRDGGGGGGSSYISGYSLWSCPVTSSYTFTNCGSSVNQTSNEGHVHFELTSHSDVDIYNDKDKTYPEQFPNKTITD